MNGFGFESLVAFLLGAVYGAFFGSIPGLTATLAVALFVPVAFFLDPAVALPAMIAIAAVAIFAGDVASVVARMPGTPASAAYVDEIVELAQKKGPAYALGISAWSSAFGGAVGTAVLVVGASGLAALATRFSSFEFFWIAVLGLTAGVLASGAPPLKSLLSLLFGVLLATVGIDPTLGFPRFYFGNPNLLGGVNYIVAMIGLFGFAEVLDFIHRGSNLKAKPVVQKQTLRRQYFNAPLRFIWKERWQVLRSALLGTFIGFLPGAGADIAAWVSSSLEKLRSRNTNPDRVVLTGSASNNSGIAGAWIPALSLGIPGDTITAIVLGIFLIKGITPGPLLFQQQIQLVWQIYLAFAVASVILLPLVGFFMAGLATVVSRIPSRLLMGPIAALSVVGAYAINNNLFDVWVMVAMGFLGFFLKKNGFPLAQLVLGLVLGPIIEQNFMVSAIKSRWDLMAFFDRPLALFLMILTLVVLWWGLRMQRFLTVTLGGKDRT